MRLLQTLKDLWAKERQWQIANFEGEIYEIIISDPAGEKYQRTYFI